MTLRHICPMNSPLALEMHAPSDAELIAAVRGGDSAAYGQLFERHRDAATRLARQIAGSSDADDLVSDAFIKVLKVLSTGGGPDLAFRAYLLTAVRRLHVDRIRGAAKVTPSDELESFDPGVPFADPAVQEFENVAASKAFASLPERWQLVLWHVEVEGQKPAEVAPLLGMSPNSVSALAYRAREGLRQAYLQMHMADTAAEECRRVTERLGARVRNGLSRRDTVKVDDHLDECPRCAAMYLELSEVNSNLAGILAPMLLGAAGAGYLASVGSGSLAAAPWLFRARHFVKAHRTATIGSTAASAVAVTVAIVVVTSGAHPGDTAAEPGGLNDRIAVNPSQNPNTSGTRGGDQPNGPATSVPGQTGPTGATATSQVGDPTQDPRDKGPSRTSATTPGGVLLTTPATSRAPGGNPTGSVPTTSDPAHPTPPTTPPTTATIPPPPPDWDLRLLMASASKPRHRYVATMSVTAPAQAKGITVTTSVGERLNSLSFTGAGWSCDPGFSHHVSVYTCTTASASPADLVASVKFHPRDKNPHLTATLSAPGNDDPVPGNNSASLTL